MSDAYYQAILDRGGGMITCGRSLGVMVGTDVMACPKGWVFVPIEIASLELIRRAVACANRSTWPKNQKRVAKNEDELLDQLFDSQDYIQ